MEPNVDPPKDIWSSQPPVARPLGQFVTTMTRVVMNSGAPSSVDMVTIFVITALMSSGVLVVLRPPMVMTRPQNDYEHATLAWFAVMCWATLAGMGTVGLRMLWN